MQEQEVTTLNIPALALRGMTVFPKMTATVDVEREISIRALERAMENDLDLFLVAQKNSSIERPGLDDLFPVGVVSRVQSMIGDRDRVLQLFVRESAACKE